MRNGVLIVEAEQHDHRGGTGVLVDRIRQLEQSGHDVRVMSAECVEELLGSTEAGIVFVQEEGGLSKRFLEWVSGVLRSGTTVVELNVFNLPSKWRPRSDNYLMATCTYDGIIRYRLRSLGGGFHAQRRYLEMPNVVSEVERYRPVPRADNHMRFIRIGRPSAIKWSAWEVEFCVAFAERFPGLDVQLTLVGAPPNLGIPPKLPQNLTVATLPYDRDIGRYFRQNDVYLHHSRIGETYGNTFAEAQMAGLFVVGAFDPRWDTAPLFFLNDARSLLGTPAWLLRHPGKLLEVLQHHRPVHQGSGVQRHDHMEITPVDYLKRLQNVEHGDHLATPNALQSFLQLAKECRRLHGVPTGIQAPMFEILRGLVLRIRLALRRSP